MQAGSVVGGVLAAMHEPGDNSIDSWTIIGGKCTIWFIKSRAVIVN